MTRKESIRQTSSVTEAFKVGDYVSNGRMVYKLIEAISDGLFYGEIIGQPLPGGRIDYHRDRARVHINPANMRKWI